MDRSGPALRTSPRAPAGGRRIGAFVVMAGRKAGGPETYEHALLRTLARIDETNEYRIFCFTENAARSFGIEQPNVRTRVIGNGFRPWNMSVNLPLALRSEGVDLMHATCVPPLYSPVDYVFTLHCSSMFIRPELFPPLVRWRLKALVRQGVHHARKVLCVSEDVLEHAVAYYKVPRERMAVTYNAVGPHFRPVPEPERKALLARLGIDRRYFLFTGRMEPRKNVTRLLEAFDVFRREVDPDMALVLAGNKTWSAGEVDATVARLGLAPHLIETGHLPNEDLPALFSGATAFVFPSLWEGFGIPVVEAMACGAPVLTSNLSSLPEVAGGAALLVDPLKVDEIAHGLERLACDELLRARLKQAGIRRAADFTWEKTARQTLEAYADV
jgi:glycosyltransferase involved in cell wall biosynthesis